MSNSPLSGLHSPPDSNTFNACESDSELSDFEVDMEATTESQMKLEPSYMRDGVPVFTPSMEQFQDFEKFITAVNPWGMTHGIIKIIPPKLWLDEQPPLHDEVKKIKIKNPYIQEMNNQESRGASGNFRQLNLSSNRTYNIVEWRLLCNQLNRQPPARRGETRKAPVNTLNMNKKSDEVGQRILESETQTPAKIGKMSSQKKTKHKEQEVSVGSRRNKYKQDNSVYGEEAFKDFDYNLYEEFDDERCQDLETAYWKHISYAPPMYGGDMPGTLFTDKTKVWDLRNLPGLLNYLDEKVPGINTTYLYLGSWKSTFSWHLEDVDLYSINYLHFGAPKQWYSISQGDRERFEKAMATKWPTEFKHCSQFLRHKTFQISPAALWKEFKIKVNKIVHRPGEFVITFPYGYHAGYNLGYNCAEAVNFAVEEWLSIGEKAKRCECAQQQDSVWVDLNSIRRKLPPNHKWYIGDPIEVDNLEGNKKQNNPLDMPTPPHSGNEVKLPKMRKRKISSKKSEDRQVKRKSALKTSEEPPCFLCPNFDFELLETDNGRRAHRICGEYIPETSVVDGVVRDTKFISKARMGLKCIYCRSKKGACFQCSAAKCTRAYHGTCAAASGVLVQKLWMSSFSPDGTEYKEKVYDFRCRFHRPRRDKKIDEASLSTDKLTLQFASELKLGEICQVQLLHSDIFAGIVISNSHTENMVTLKVLFDQSKTHYEVDYKWILAPPVASALPKPSASAIPMPISFKVKESLNTCSRQANDLPRTRDIFGDNLIWAEFISKPICLNKNQVKIDMMKENQLWYYIGNTSTEAKAHYTNDLSKPWNNPKSHFLNTLPKPISTLHRHPQITPHSTSRSGRLASQTRPGLTASKAPSVESMNRIVSCENQKKSRPKSKPIVPIRVGKQNSSSSHTSIHSHVADLRDKSRLIESKSSKKILKDSKHVRNLANIPSPSSTNDCKKQSSLLLTQPSWPSFNRSTPTPATYSSGKISRKAHMIHQHAKSPPQNHFSKQFPKNSGNSISSRSIMPLSSLITKYRYLQVEHNKDEKDYKSPYRVGGGFMNGYEGSLDGLRKYSTEVSLKKITKAIPLPPITSTISLTRGTTQSAIGQHYQHQNQTSCPVNILNPYKSKVRLSPMVGNVENCIARNASYKFERPDSSIINFKRFINNLRTHKAENFEDSQDFKHATLNLPQHEDKKSSLQPVHLQPKSDDYRSIVNPKIEEANPRSEDCRLNGSKIIIDNKTSHRYQTSNPNSFPQNAQSIIQQGRNAHLPLVQSFNQFHHRAQYPPQKRNLPIIPDVPPDTSTIIERMMNNLKKASSEIKSEIR